MKVYLNFSLSLSRKKIKKYKNYILFIFIVKRMNLYKCKYDGRSLKLFLKLYCVGQDLIPIAILFILSASIPFILFNSTKFLILNILV